MRYTIIIILLITIVRMALLIPRLSSEEKEYLERCKKYTFREMEVFEGVHYWSIENNNSGVGVEYATMEEVSCFYETGTFNYFESCMECYHNAIFIQF